MTFHKLLEYVGNKFIIIAPIEDYILWRSHDLLDDGKFRVTSFYNKHRKPYYKFYDVVINKFKYMGLKKIPLVILARN